MKRLVIGTVLMVLWVSSILLLPGCGGASEAQAAEAQTPRPLSFVVVNQSNGNISGIGLEGASKPMSFGPITKGERRVLSDKSLVLPEKLTLHWDDARGDRREGTVRVWSELGASYSGPVTLTVTGRGKVVLTGG